MTNHTETLRRICERFVEYSHSSARVYAIVLDRSVYVRDLSLSDLMLYIILENQPDSYSNMVDSFSNALGVHTAVLKKEDGRIFSFLLLDDILHFNAHFFPRGESVQFSQNAQLLWASSDFVGFINERIHPTGRSPISDNQIECIIKTGLLRAAAKALRGEVVESIRVLTDVRQRLMRKIVNASGGARNAGIRRFEQNNSHWVTAVHRAIPASYSKLAVAAAIRAALELNSLLSMESAATAVGAEIDDQICEMLSCAELIVDPRASLETDVEMQNYATTFLHRLAHCAQMSGALQAVGIVGSWRGPSRNQEIGVFDQFSDLDILLIPKEGVMQCAEERIGFVQRIPECVLAFEKTQGSIWALYGERLLRADCRFVSLDEMQRRYENPDILWESEGCLTQIIQNTDLDTSLNLYPQPSIDWVDVNTWIGIVNAHRLCGEGRLIEAVDELDYLRYSSLGPLLAIASGVPCRGVRRVEFRFSMDVELLARTVGEAGYLSCLHCINQAIISYKSIRSRIKSPYRYGDLEAKVQKLLIRDITEAGALDNSISQEDSMRLDN